MIEVNNISKSYHNKNVLKNVSFKVHSGKIIGLKGNNGVGKSTLVNIMGGLTKADGGFTLFDGKKLSDGDAALKKRIGCVFESPLYIKMLTGREFLLFMAKMYDFSCKDAQQAVNDVLKFFGLTSDANLLIGKYSKGMKARLSIATAIFHQPAYLLLDEPFAGIDEHFRPEIIDRLKKTARNGVAILLVSHDARILQLLADLTYELADGKIHLTSESV